MNWIAALPMYNVTPALAGVWHAYLHDVVRRVSPQTSIVDPGEDLHAFWRRPGLLLSQTCGYPLVASLHDAVQLVATPEFDAPGCNGAQYASVLVTRANALHDTLEACRGARAAFNQDDSNSGMNLFRHAVASLARDGVFFGATVRTGSHLASLRAIVENRADVAAIDCVTFAFVQSELPELAQQLRQIGWTRSSPGLPLIAARNVPAPLIDALRVALEDARAEQPDRAQRLRLRGFAVLPLAAYSRISELENEAVAAGYPRLA